jgi:hypothetical protein
MLFAENIVHGVEMSKVKVGFGTGRFYLEVAGHVTVVEGDVCRDPKILEEVPEDGGSRKRVGYHIWTKERICHIVRKINGVKNVSE